MAKGKWKKLSELKTPEKEPSKTTSPKKKIPVKDSIKNLRDQYEIAKREGDTVQMTIIDKIIKRLESKDLIKE